MRVVNKFYYIWLSALNCSKLEQKRDVTKLVAVINGLQQII